jgi:hypothetical protein
VNDQLHPIFKPIVNSLMTTKHTPGPWKAECLFKDLDRWEIWGDGKIVSSHVFGKSDARLIAAAPELLEACKLALECLSPFSDEDTDGSKTTIRKAIAKAEGKS